MKNLGRMFLLIFLVSNTIYASVIASVEPKSLYAGEEAEYKLTINGKNVKKPLIDTICGNDIISTGSQTSIQMINGNYTKSYTLSYRFVPQKSCVIDAIDVDVDGEIQHSNSVKVNVKPISQDKNADFVLSLKPSKNELYVGEPFELTLILKQKKSAEVVDSKFIAPDFKGFWIKGESPPKRKEDGEYLITKAIYTLSAQRDGNLSIKPAQLKIASRVNTRDMWGSFMPQVKWRSYFSNEVNIKAKPLPHGAKIVGDFSINVSVDKKIISPNEALNLTVEVVGNGNLEDIKSFKPYINGVNVFDEKIVINGNKLTQKLAFVSDNDFTIPPFSLEFFNLKTNRVEKITTKEIKIKVTGEKKSSELNIKRDDTKNTQQDMHKEVIIKNEINKTYIIIAFVVGLVLGLFIMITKPFVMLKKEKSFNIKDEKLLLIKLLPYKDDIEVKKIVDILEHNLYASDKKKLDKKLLKELLKKYNIS
jgi:hypothetical protein